MKHPCALRTQFWFRATWSINILTFMITLCSIFFSRIQHSVSIWQICEITPIAHIDQCFWERLNNSGFGTITIPMDRISVSVIFLSPQGLIEVPCINLLPRQRKIIVHFTMTPTWFDNVSWRSGKKKWQGLFGSEDSLLKLKSDSEREAGVPEICV